MRLRVAAAQVNLTVGDVDGNAARILEIAGEAHEAGCDIICFPELALSGYPPEDLLLKPAFVQYNETVLNEIVAELPDIVAIIGTIHYDGDLYNSAAICVPGEIAGYYHKRHLPNYGVFDEKRYFAPGRSAAPLLKLSGVHIGVTICEDIWVSGGPMLEQAKGGAQLAINISGSPFHRGKLATRRSMLATRAADCACPLVFVNLVGGQDELVFDGGSMLFDEAGELVASVAQFREALAIWDIDCVDVLRHRLRDTRPREWERLDLDVIDLDADHPELSEPHFVFGQSPLNDTSIKTIHDPPWTYAVAPVNMPPNKTQVMPAVLESAEEIYRALVLGVRDYLGKNGFYSTVIGLSGGIDSSLVATIAVDALGTNQVTGIAMPSEYSSESSETDARLLAKNLGIRFEVVPIGATYDEMLRTLKPLFKGSKPGLTEENLQSRIRGNILMAFSNKFGSIVLSTGNKSEMATGYTTLYGDMAGGYAVLKDVPKVLVYELCGWRNEWGKTQGQEPIIPESVLSKPPSAELRPGQLDTDVLPPYDVLDPIIMAYVEQDMVASEIVAAGLGDPDIVESIVRMIDGSEYKRRQSPPGVRITPKAFGRDRRPPITNAFRPTKPIR